MTRFPGLGHRFSERLRVLGYWKDGHADVGRFCREKSYRPQYVYAWLKDRMPAYQNLQRLCSDLEVPATWFVVGDEATAPAIGARARHQNGRRRATGLATEMATPPSSIDLGPLIEATAKVASLQADLEALLAAFPDACWWFDHQGKVLNVTGAVTAAERSSVGRSIREIFPPDAATALSRGIATALRSGDITTFELARPSGSGRRAGTYEARIRPVTDGGSRTRKVLVVIRDVSERQLRDREYQELIEGGTNGLCIHDDEWEIRYANRTIVRMLGYDRPADLVGRDVRELLPAHTALRAATPRGDVERTMRKTTTDAVSRDGTRRMVEVLARRTTWHAKTAILLTVIGSSGGGEAYYWEF